MESAFGESQEMVIFITELNANKYCARFIRDNGSAKFDHHRTAENAGFHDLEGFGEQRTEPGLLEHGKEFAAFLD